MFERSLYHDLVTHLNEKQVTVITGLRRVGKTTAIKYLLDKIAHSNKLYIDLERVEHRKLFLAENYDETRQGLELLGVKFDRPCVIALDEIQLLPRITSIIKYFYDHYGIKFLVTGSSSFYLKDKFSESLSGRKKIFELFPLSFSEYIDFKQLRNSELNSFSMMPFAKAKAFYTVYRTAYIDYLYFGGFPEVVLSEDVKKKEDFLLDILNSYIELDVKILSDFSLNDELYRLVQMLATRVGSRVDFNKLSSLTGINRIKLKDYFNLFEKTYLIHRVAPFTYNIDREISAQPKLYFADTGLLRKLNIHDEAKLFENAVLCQLLSLGKVNYYQKKTGQEIDFILNGKKAFEVKLTSSAADLKKLISLSNSIKIDDCHLIALNPSPSGFRQFIWGGNIF